VILFGVGEDPILCRLPVRLLFIIGSDLFWGGFSNSESKGQLCNAV
jgi:hypothetical protein